MNVIFENVRRENRGEDEEGLLCLLVTKVLIFWMKILILTNFGAFCLSLKKNIKKSSPDHTPQQP